MELYLTKSSKAKGYTCILRLVCLNLLGILFLPDSDSYFYVSASKIQSFGHKPPLPPPLCKLKKLIFYGSQSRSGVGGG